MRNPRKAAAPEDAIVASVLASADDRWDSSPLKLPGWWANLQRAIPRDRAAHAALIKYGYVATRATVCTANAFHSQALASGSYGPFSYMPHRRPSRRVHLLAHLRRPRPRPLQRPRLEVRAPPRQPCRLRLPSL